VRVAAEAVNPGDWDAANNSRETTIQIISPQASLHGGAYASQYQSEYQGRSRGAWTNDYSSASWHEEYGQVYEAQNTSIYGAAQAGLDVAQASVEFTVSSGGTELFSSSGAMDWTWDTCAYRWSDQEWAHVCSAGESTWVNAGHHAERATYFSRGYWEQWSHWDGEYYYWEYDNRYDHQYGSFKPYGTQVDLSIRVTDGAQTYAAAPSVTLIGDEYSWGSPTESCYTYSYPYDNSSYESCQASWGVQSHRYGWTSF
jgi:hypothetical protein